MNHFTSNLGRTSDRFTVDVGALGIRHGDWGSNASCTGPPDGHKLSHAALRRRSDPVATDYAYHPLLPAEAAAAHGSTHTMA
jgi:hypothetical protein